MQQHVQELVRRFAEVNDALRSLVEPCTTTQWQTPCVVGEWSVGVTVHHIANGYDQEGWVAAVIAAILAGQRLPPQQADGPAGQDFNEWHAHHFATYTQEETLAVLRHNEAAVLGLIEGLQDEDLERTAPTSSGSGRVSLRRIIEAILINHAQEHLRSLQAALETG
ncbi:MAG TPA: DinB family protein [Ktedonobacterales bacterium]|jgi:hypothetical protein